jgi:hypothetical protein
MPMLGRQSAQVDMVDPFPEKNQRQDRADKKSQEIAHVVRLAGIQLMPGKEHR